MLRGLRRGEKRISRIREGSIPWLDDCVFFCPSTRLTHASTDFGHFSRLVCGGPWVPEPTSFFLPTKVQKWSKVLHRLRLLSLIFTGFSNCTWESVHACAALTVPQGQKFAFYSYLWHFEREPWFASLRNAIATHQSKIQTDFWHTSWELLQVRSTPYAWGNEAQKLSQN